MKAKTKQVLFPIAAVAFFMVVAVLMMVTKQPPEKKKPEASIPFVTTEVVDMQPYVFEVQSQGLVEPRYHTELVAQVSGEIVQIADVFVRGGIVKKGDVLARIDPSNYQVNLEQANAQLASARAAFVLERAQGQVAEAEWQNITSAKPSQLGLRKPQQAQALAGVKAAEASLQQAEKDLQRTDIVAPFDAIIESRAVSPGGFVNVGSTIGSLMDIAVAEVRLPINKNHFHYLQNRGLSAAVTLTAQVGEQQLQWQARVVRDEGVVDDATRMIYLVAALDHPYTAQEARLPFGTFVQAAITGRQLPSAARLPRSAIRDGLVAKVVDNRLKLQPVTVERHVGKHAVVSDGINNGDRVLVSALDNLSDGMQVDFAEPVSAPQLSGVSTGAH